MTQATCSKEYWKVIEYAKNYEISNFGNIRRGQRVIKSHMNLATKGFYYREVNLLVNYKRRKYLVARLVADAFMENDGSRYQITYKDGDRSNCRLDNLEFKSKIYDLYDKYDNYVSSGTITDLAKVVNVKPKSMTWYLRGERKKYKLYEKK